MLSFAVVTSLLSFIFVGSMSLFKDYLRNWETTVKEQHFVDRINKEKYLEEAGYNVMNDPW